MNVEEFLSTLSEETRAELVMFHFNLFMKHVGKSINDENKIDTSKVDCSEVIKSITTERDEKPGASVLSIATERPRSKARAALIILKEFGTSKSMKELMKIANERWNINLMYYDISNVKFNMKRFGELK